MPNPAVLTFPEASTVVPLASVMFAATTLPGPTPVTLAFEPV